ncbi:MAG: Do family serine endopeptidase [Planctomycetes bacterium]|nr:Do family serine endopeptidase [Planctomycetota bacterium]
MSSKLSNKVAWAITWVVIGAATAGIALIPGHQTTHAWAQAPVAKVTPVDPAATQNARGLSKVFRQASDTILPAVVAIDARTGAKQIKRSGPQQRQMQPGENPFKGTPFEDMFKDFGGNGMQGMPFEQHSQPQESMGSGVIIDSSGIVLTNNHVVQGADEITVRLSDGREFKANTIKTDPQTDLAVIYLKGASNLPSAKLGDSDALEIGDWVIAVGNPFGLESTVSAGIISGKGRSIRADQRARYLQTDAAINPGNSGGPLVNLDGEVIGINTAIYSRSGGYQGIGFAIPSNLARWVVDQLIKRGNVQRAYLGVGIEPLTASLAEKLGVQDQPGVVVTEVFPDSPAATAKFHEGDVIVDFAGKKVRNTSDLREVVEQLPIDSRQPVKVLRDGKPMTLEVVMQTLPDSFGKTARRSNKQNDESQSPQFASNEWGLEVSELTPDVAKQLNIRNAKGVVVTSVEEGSPAEQAKVRVGMVILRVGQKTIENVGDFQATLKDASLKEGLLLLVRAGERNEFIVIKGQ